LNIQNRLERAVVPTPSAARGTTPNDDMKAVSTRAVIGSAVSEKRTGIDKPIRVLCGFLMNGWELEVMRGLSKWNFDKPYSTLLEEMCWRYLC
jgi:hypothetical protein